MQKSNKNTSIKFWDFWKNLWDMLEPFQGRVKFLLIFLIVEQIIQLAIPYLLKITIDSIENFGPEKVNQIIFLIASMFLVNQGNSIVVYFLDRFIFRIVIDIEEFLFSSTQNKMVTLGLGYHEKENTGNKISKVQKGIWRLIDLVGNVSWHIFPAIFQVFVAAIVLFFVDWRFGLIFLIFVPAFVFLTYQFNKKNAPLRRQRYDRYEESGGKMAEVIININTVKSFAQEEREISNYQNIAEKIKNLSLAEFFSMLKYNLGRNSVVNFGEALIILLGVFLVIKNEITVGSLVFVITVSGRAFFSIYNISRLYDRMMESWEAIVRLRKLEKEKNEIESPQNAIEPKKIIGKIEFQNVSFRYDKERGNALDDFSVKINSDCMTAVVGPSGGGKTTLIKMIYRHYDPQKGRILLDGQDLKKYDLISFRKFFAIVPQEVEIFNASIKENIAYSNPKAGMQEIEAAAKIANADEFIVRFERGYETLVGERGIRLSGGQRQRVGIARAILANPRVLIFDEATSNLDSHSERLIQEAIGKISRGRTMIVIAHRLSTIQRADKIIVLENGKLVEEGNHTQLSQKNGGLYAKLLKLQDIGEIEE